MKKCDYCGKLISNFEMYCCDECERSALRYYKNEKRFKNIFGFFNVLCIVSVLIFCFVSLLFSKKNCAYRLRSFTYHIRRGGCTVSDAYS